MDRRSIVRALADDRGDSLVEILMSITLTAIAMGAIFTALSGVTIGARAHDVNVQAESALAQAKQSLEDAAYDASGYVPPAIPGASVTYSAPSAVTGAPSLQSITVQVTVGAETRTTVVQKAPR